MGQEGPSRHVPTRRPRRQSCDGTVRSSTGATRPLWSDRIRPRVDQLPVTWRERKQFLSEAVRVPRPPGIDRFRRFILGRPRLAIMARAGCGTESRRAGNPTAASENSNWTEHQIRPGYNKKRRVVSCESFDSPLTTHLGAAVTRPQFTFYSADAPGSCRVSGSA